MTPIGLRPEEMEQLAARLRGAADSLAAATARVRSAAACCCAPASVFADVTVCCDRVANAATGVGTDLVDDSGELVRRAALARFADAGAAVTATPSTAGDVVDPRIPLLQRLIALTAAIAAARQAELATGTDPRVAIIGGTTVGGTSSGFVGGSPVLDGMGAVVGGSWSSTATDHDFGRSAFAGLLAAGPTPMAPGPRTSRSDAQAHLNLALSGVIPTMMTNIANTQAAANRAFSSAVFGTPYDPYSPTGDPSHPY